MDASQGQTLTPDQMRDQRLQRTLKIVVVVLGTLIIAALGAVVAGIFSMSTAPSQPASATSSTTAIASSGAKFEVEIPNGARVVGTSVSGNRLAVHYEGPAGTGITIVDLETGKSVGDVRVRQAVPVN